MCSNIISNFISFHFEIIIECNFLGSFDFFGLNHYTTNLVRSGEEGPIPSFGRDIGAVFTYNETWETAKSPWLKVIQEIFHPVV